MPIMAALFSHVTLMQIFLQKGWLNPLFGYLFGYVFISTARHSAISFLLQNICGVILIITKQKTAVYISVQLRRLC